MWLEFDVRQSAGDQHGVTLSGNEAAHQMVGQEADELLHGLYVVVARLAQPAPQALDRPHVTQSGFLLEGVVHLADDAERLRRIERRAVLPLDHHVHRIGAGKLLVDAARRIERLLAIGHLIGKSVARRQVGEGGPEQEEQRYAQERIEIGPVHHAVDDLADDGAKAVHQGVGRRVVLGQRLLVADEHDREDRQHQNDGDERHADGDGAGLTERADQA